MVRRRSSGADELFEVEKIVGQRKRDGRVEYEVKWKGYAKKYNTWEPAENLMCPTILDEWYEKQKKASMPSVSKRYGEADAGDESDGSSEEAVRPKKSTPKRRTPKSDKKASSHSAKKSGKKSLEKKSLSDLDDVIGEDSDDAWITGKKSKVQVEGGFVGPVAKKPKTSDVRMKVIKYVGPDGIVGAAEPPVTGEVPEVTSGEPFSKEKEAPEKRPAIDETPASERASPAEPDSTRDTDAAVEFEKVVGKLHEQLVHAHGEVTRLNDDLQNERKRLQETYETIGRLEKEVQQERSENQRLTDIIRCMTDAAATAPDAPAPSSPAAEEAGPSIPSEPAVPSEPVCVAGLACLATAENSL